MMKCKYVVVCIVFLLASSEYINAEVDECIRIRNKVIKSELEKEKTAVK